MAAALARRIADGRTDLVLDHLAAGGSPAGAGWGQMDAAAIGRPHLDV